MSAYPGRCSEVYRSRKKLFVFSSHLSPDTGSVVKVVFVVRQLPDAVVDSDAALARSHVFL